MLTMIWVIALVILVFYILNLNKKSSPELFDKFPDIFEEIEVQSSPNIVYGNLLKFSQSSRYKLDHADNTANKLILNYTPQMGEQTNGTFFPIVVSPASGGGSKIKVGAKDKSSISMSFEAKNALDKLLTQLNAVLYSSNQGAEISISQKSSNEYKSQGKTRDLNDDFYKIYLIKKYGLEKNDVLSKVIVKDKIYNDIDSALEYLHAIDLEEFLKIEEDNKIRNTIKSTGFFGNRSYTYIEYANGRVVVKHDSSGVSSNFNSLEDAKKDFKE